MTTSAQPSYIKPAPSKAGIKHLALMREACQLTEAIDEATQADPDFCKEIAPHLLTWTFSCSRRQRPMPRAHRSIRVTPKEALNTDEPPT